MSVLELARPELLNRKGYQAAKGRFDMVRLHANEMPESDDEDHLSCNRYPPPRPYELHQALAQHIGVDEHSIMITRGSNEGIDLLIRAFCRTGTDAIVVNSPTFGMYRVCAEVQGADCLDVELDSSFELNTKAIVDACHSNGKIAFICSPANPTGNRVPLATIASLCAQLKDKALVVVDQAYAEFADDDHLVKMLNEHQNLVILRTFSKAYGLAGLRCGIVLSNSTVIQLLDSILAPYAVPTPTIEGVLKAMTPARLSQTKQRIEQILSEKQRLSLFLESSSLVCQVHPSETNFLLVKFEQSDRVYSALLQRSVLVRRFDQQARLSGCLRITIGSPSENNLLISTLEDLA